MRPRKLRVRGYRRLFSIDLEMRPLTVLIGPNGAGKTSLMETLFLLAESARGALDQTLSDLGGIADVVTKGKTDTLRLGVSMEVPDHQPLEYNLAVKTKGIGYEISEEGLTQKNPNHDEPFKYIDARGSNIKFWDRDERTLMRPDWDYSENETSLSQVPKMFRNAEQFRNTLASSTYYSAYRLNLDQQAPIRLPQKMQPATHPGRNGEHLVSCLYYLRETNALSYEIIEDTLSAAFPGFSRLNFPPVAAGTITMTWQEEHFDQPLYLNQLSEGTLRFLWLLTLLHSPDLPAITMIDEPEVSLHPQMIAILVDTFREVSQRSHLVIATHSDRLVRFLEPEELVVTDTEDGLATFSHAEDMDLTRWLADYSLDELWHMGRLGGTS